MYFEDPQDALMALPEDHRLVPEEPEFKSREGEPVTRERSTPGIWALWGPAFDRNPNREADAVEEYSKEFRPEGMTGEQFWGGIEQETVLQFFGKHQLTRVWHRHPEVEDRWVIPNRFATKTLEELLAVISEVALAGDEDCPLAQAACQSFVEQVNLPELFWQGAFWQVGPLTEEGIRQVVIAAREGDAAPDLIYCPRQENQ